MTDEPEHAPRSRREWVAPLVVGAVAVYAMLRTLRLREILGRAKAAQQSEEGTAS